MAFLTRWRAIFEGNAVGTVTDVRAEVLNAVFADHDRSVEGVVDRAIAAGIEFERARIRAILELSAPAGLEKALVALALSPNTTVDVAAEFFAKFPLDPRHAETLRAGFRVVRTTEKIKETLNA
jgi:hypothetical protein